MSFVDNPADGILSSKLLNLGSQYKSASAKQILASLDMPTGKEYCHALFSLHRQTYGVAQSADVNKRVQEITNSLTTILGSKGSNEQSEQGNYPHYLSLMNDITNIRSLLFTTGTEDDTEITRIEEDFINCSGLKNDPTMLALAQMYKEIALHRLIINGKNGITYDSVEQVIKRLKKFYKTKVSE